MSSCPATSGWAAARTTSCYVENNQLITSIEIASPSNKRDPGLSAYLTKRDELRIANVHLLEIDLLRRGTQPWPAEQLPQSPYMAALIRARHIQAEVWPIGLRDPDPDVPLDLQAALDTIYDEADYSLTLNNAAPPPEPALSADDSGWAAMCVRAWQVSKDTP